MKLVNKSKIFSDYNDDNLSYSNEVASQRSSMLIGNLIWMNSGEAASYLRKSVGALRTAVCRGQIKAKKFHRRLYFNRKELDRMLEASQTIGGY